MAARVPPSMYAAMSEHDSMTWPCCIADSGSTFWHEEMTDAMIVLARMALYSFIIRGFIV